MASVNGDSASAGNPGVFGQNTAEGGAGVYGQANANGAGGVIGHADKGRGVYGESPNGTGVWGWSKTGTGVVGASNGSNGILGTSDAPGQAGVAGVNENGIGILGRGGRLAGLFEGDVEVTGDIRLTNADCAEDFDIAEADLIDSGTVMVIGKKGALQQSDQAYDKRVAGVVSGAGDYKPGIVLDKQQAQPNRKPIALLGKVYCKVDAQYGAVEVGDLLTTSPTLGHAMKVADPLKACGAVIGKALRPLTEGQGLIPILIALQ